MTKQVINFGTATIDIEIFEAYQRKAMQCLRDAHSHTEKAKEFKLDFNEHVESVAKTTGLPKKEIVEFWKARFEETLPKEEDKKKGTKITIDRGQLFDTLNTALEN